MISPDKPETNDSDEQCVPTEAFAIDGTSPAVGDDVEFTGRGRVSRVEDGKTYFSLTEVNGKPVTAEPDEKEATSEDDMMRMAEEADRAAAG